MDDEDGREPDNYEFKSPKAWKDLVVRQNKNPETTKFVGPLDTYLNKTSIRSIAFSQHKVRWKKIVDADLYSKTAQRGIPRMQRTYIAGADKMIKRSPPFFKDSKKPHTTSVDCTNSDLPDNSQRSFDRKGIFNNKVAFEKTILSGG